MIALDFPLELFSKCLKSGSSGSSRIEMSCIKLKLCKRDNQPTMRIAMRSQSENSVVQRGGVSHELPVHVYNTSLVLSKDPLVATPNPPKCHFIIVISSVRVFRSVIERIRNVGHVATLSFNHSTGVLSCLMSNDMVSIETQFGQVRLIDESGEDVENRENVSEATVCVDANRLLRALQPNLVHPIKVLLGLKNDSFAVITLQIDTLVAQYIVPHFSV